LPSAHLNLREQFLPHKILIGQVLLDKNPNIRTVINKIEVVGSTNPFRTFQYEVLAGPNDLNVTVSLCNCEFKFDFSKVYWNPRLNTEHERLVDSFKEGEAVCDVMAGVGPFAVLAGKKNIFVSANDLNPDCNTALEYAIRRNKVGAFVTASCMDGRQFIRRATRDWASKDRSVVILQKRPDSELARSGSRRRRRRFSNKLFKAPITFQHYVMNLPASAVEFLDAFRGLHAGESDLFVPNTPTALPLVHVYCFTEGKELQRDEEVAVYKLVSERLGHSLSWGDPDTKACFVRRVSPKKKMYCFSFRLPPEVAFAE
jgi:tRNA (guanine37-N1)-methyltransferase